MIFQSAIKLIVDAFPGFLKLRRRLWGSIEYVYSAASFDKSLCYREAEALTTSRHNEDLPIDVEVTIFPVTDIFSLLIRRLLVRNVSVRCEPLSLDEGCGWLELRQARALASGVTQCGR